MKVHTSDKWITIVWTTHDYRREVVPERVKILSQIPDAIYNEKGYWSIPNMANNLNLIKKWREVENFKSGKTIYKKKWTAVPKSKYRFQGYLKFG